MQIPNCFGWNEVRTNNIDSIPMFTISCNMSLKAGRHSLIFSHRSLSKECSEDSRCFMSLPDSELRLHLSTPSERTLTEDKRYLSLKKEGVAIELVER
jgi:hypothetical protein